jgi:hypothetical protein
LPLGRSIREVFVLSFVLAIIWLGVAGSALVAGLDYYLLPMDQRAYSSLAPVFSPTGIVGHGFGIVGTFLIVVGVVGYMARKRLSPLAHAGSLKHWLQVHIFLCTLGPFLVLLHTTFKFGGLVSIAFWSMTIVVVSGVFGRYVYARIPKTVNGRFLGLEMVRDRLSELSAAIAARTHLPVAELESVLAPATPVTWNRSLAAALATAVRNDVRQRRHLRGVRRYLHARRVPRELHGPVLSLVREQRRLHQRAALLQPFQRLFRYWHVIHLPLAMVMFLVLSVHVVVAVLFGYTWIF